MRQIPGGKGANQAVAAARAGARVAILGSVGTDEFGVKLKATLEKEGIDVRGVHESSHSPSGVALITIDERGESLLRVRQKPAISGRPEA